MSEIYIKTCGYCSNADALEAVSKLMQINGLTRGYKETREVTTESGYVIKVTEMQRDDWKTTCNGSFEVERVDK